ncbi:hypothetical protein [Sphingobium olei]|uniref:Uncharacterized protein n=1 Tax=Sphingobium olei TaxID=420955 RepID=A0ABW3NZK0_9SPHN
MPGENDFELWLGHVGADRGVTGRLARARRLGSAGSARGRRFTGAAIGRGSSVGRVLGASDRFASLRVRRVVVKARIVKLGGKGMAAAAHLRYLQRDGVTRTGERGALWLRRGSCRWQASSSAGRAIATSSASSSRPRMAGSMRT